MRSREEADFLTSRAVFQSDRLDLPAVHFDPDTIQSVGLGDRVAPPFALQHGLWRETEPGPSRAPPLTSSAFSGESLNLSEPFSLRQSGVKMRLAGAPRGEGLTRQGYVGSWQSDSFKA